MGIRAKTKKKAERRKKKAARKQAMRELYKKWAADGMNKKSKRAVKRMTGSKLVKDHKTVNVAAAVARPALGKPPGWMNRKASKLLGLTVVAA